jgi:ribosomal protein L37AE/L43A
MEALLLVISNFDLSRYGCPYCGALGGSIFIINGTCSIWSCSNCDNDCCVVGKSVEEVSQFTIRNTDIKDLIGNHPFQEESYQINSFALRMNSIQMS